MSTSYNQANRFSNVHTEGMGYVSSWKEQEGNTGGFTTVTFCMLEGSQSHLEQVYVSVSLACPKAKALLEPYLDEINHRDVKVFAGFRLAKFRATPFVYPESSAKSGQLGVNYSARLIKVMYLKVGDLVVNLPKEKTTTRTDYGVAANHSTQAQPSAQSELREKRETPQVESGELFEQPLVVELSKGDPNFEETKTRLRDSGYRWHSDMVAWVVPEVVLQADDPKLLAKRQALAAQGYSNDMTRDGLTWRMTFGRLNAPASKEARVTAVQTRTSLFGCDLEVELSKDDPNFESRKAQLQAQGYKWDRQQFKWALATLSLAADSAVLANQQATLQQKGYSNPSNDGLTWERADLFHRRNRSENGYAKTGQYQRQRA